MMVDAYRGMSKGFNPSKSDVDTYVRVLDRNGDGKVTLQDLEALAIKYLVSNRARLGWHLLGLSEAHGSPPVLQACRRAIGGGEAAIPEVRPRPLGLHHRRRGTRGLRARFQD